MKRKTPSALLIFSKLWPDAGFRKVTVAPTTALPFALRTNPCSAALFGGVWPGKRCCVVDCRVNRGPFVRSDGRFRGDTVATREIAPEAPKDATHNQHRSQAALAGFAKDTRDGACILSGLARTARFETQKVMRVSITVFLEPGNNFRRLSRQEPRTVS